MNTKLDNAIEQALESVRNFGGELDDDVAESLSESEITSDEAELIAARVISTNFAKCLPEFFNDSLRKMRMLD